MYFFPTKWHYSSLHQPILKIEIVVKLQQGNLEKGKIDNHVQETKFDKVLIQQSLQNVIDGYSAKLKDQDFSKIHCEKIKIISHS